MPWPSVGVVVPTRDRPAEVRQALAAIAAQDYPGRIEVVVVFDQADPDHRLASDVVRVTGNTRTPGLAGARNSGILAVGTDLVAFCDDDDVWLPGKLRAQVGALVARPGALFASCGIRVRFEDRAVDRLAGRDQVSYADLLRSRMVMVHSSTYLADRQALIDRIGLLDETIPGSQNEDWDLALRAAATEPIVNLDRPLVEVRWGAGSHYARQWSTKVASLRWMLEHHPDIARDRIGAARVYAQIAFGHACLGQRAEATRWTLRALRGNWRERRVPFVLAVASGAVSGERVLRILHARGHGI
ncbi:MAG: glycosyltransferase family 2 protein [Streptosporangiaceae bacterium]